MSVDGHCDNCGARLHGQYCSNCGQAAKSPVLTLRELTGDLLKELTDSDSRIWRTMWPLCFRPGLLTSDYVSGRRGRYLPPFRTYLVLSLLFFLIASLVGTGWRITISSDAHSDAPTGRPAPESAGTMTDLAERGLISPDVAARSAARDADAGASDCDDIRIADFGPWEGATLERVFREACRNVQADESRSLWGSLVDNVPVMMFFFLPVVAIMMQILYVGSGRRYVEHLLFLLNCHAAFFLFLTVIVLAVAVSAWRPSVAWPARALLVATWLYIPVYLLLAMKRVYGGGWLGTGLRFALLIAGYGITLVLAISATATYTALTM